MHTYEIQLQLVHEGTKNVTDITQLERAHTAEDALTQVRTNIVEKPLTNMRIRIRSIKPRERQLRPDDSISPEVQSRQTASMVNKSHAMSKEMKLLLKLAEVLSVDTNCNAQELEERTIHTAEDTRYLYSLFMSLADVFALTGKNVDMAEETTKRIQNTVHHLRMSYELYSRDSTMYAGQLELCRQLFEKLGLEVPK